MKTHRLISLLGFILFLTTLNGQIGPINCGMTDTVPAEGSSLSQDCNISFSDFRSHHADDMVPQGIDRTLKIKTNVIFVQDE